MDVVYKGHDIKIDKGDLPLLQAHNWQVHKHVRGSFYLERIETNNKKHQGFALHRVVAGTPVGMITDHINHNTLDNRRKNLRVCSHRENMFNQKSKVGTSKYKGVGMYRTGKWRSYICQNRKYYHLGYFENEIDAAKAYDIAARNMFGEFAGVNFA